MLVGRQARPSYPREQVLEGWVVGGVRTEDEHVDEEADEVVESFVRAARHTTAQRDVGPRTQPRQQRRHTGLQHHEHRRVRPPRQLHQTPMQLSIQLEDQLGALVAGRGRPGPVGGKGHLLRQVRQLRTPVVHLLGEHTLRVGLVAEQFALPERVVDVLDRKLGPLRVALLDPGGVRLHHITRQWSHRPAVTRDVMHEQHQDALVGPEPEQPCAQGDIRGEVEGVAGCGVQGTRQLVLGDRPALPVEVEGVRGEDELVRLAVDLREHRTQGFVPLHHVPKCRPKRLRVDIAFEPERQRHVVRGRRPLQLVQEPQATLSEGQRDHELIPSGSSDKALGTPPWHPRLVRWTSPCGGGQRSGCQQAWMKSG